jgi:hypothetical protein
MTFLDSRLFVTHTSATAFDQFGLPVARLLALWRHRYAQDSPQRRRADTVLAGTRAAAIDLDGWRIGRGICRDTGVDEKVYGTARLGVDLCACGIVHHAWELAEQQHRARNIAATGRAPVAMARFGPPTVL